MTTTYCTAVLRPEGIACTLPKGHGRYICKDSTEVDHCNVAKQWTDGRTSREGIEEWGFNNPLNRRLEDQDEPWIVAIDMLTQENVQFRSALDLTITLLDTIGPEVTKRYLCAVVLAHDFEARARLRSEYLSMKIDPSITCPRCRQTSYSPADIESGYCGFCRDFTSSRGRDEET